MLLAGSLLLVKENLMSLHQNKVYKLRRAFIPLALEYFSLALPICIVFYLLHIFNNLTNHYWFSNNYSLLTGFSVSMLLAGLEIFRRYFNELYIFGHQRIIHFSGCLSFNMRKISIYYSDITEVDLHQGLLGRAAGFGTLQFGTASTDALEIVFTDMPLPNGLGVFIQDVIGTYRRGGDSTKLDHLFKAFSFRNSFVPIKTQ